jgi:hypothetical protein
MRIVTFITDPRVVDRILRHRKASVREPMTLSNQGRIPLRPQTLGNNSGDAADVRLLNRTPVQPRCALNAGTITGGTRGNQDWQGLDGERSAYIRWKLPSNPCQS